MIANIETSEAFGDERLPNVELKTYSPTVVYRLGRAIEVDSVATERATRKLYNGYAGSKARQDVVVARESPSSQPYLMTWPGKQRIP